MTHPFTVACLQAGRLGDTPGARREAMTRDIERAADADLIVLPELWPVGYFAFEDYDAAAEPLDGPTLTALSKAARSVNAHIITGSLIERSEQGLHNTTAVIDPDGALIASYRKIHVFGYGSRETELVTGGTAPTVLSTELGRIGLAICYDLRFPELFRMMVDEGAEMFVIPAAWPQARSEHWRVLLQARAIENQAYVIGSNGAGAPDGTVLAGRSVVIDPWGERIAEASAQPTTLTATVERDRVTDCRNDFPALADRRLGHADRIAG